jgi:hypothetical protein
LIHTLSKRIGGSRHKSTNHRPFARNNRWEPSAEAPYRRYNPRINLAQGVERGIQTNIIRTPRKPFIPSIEQQSIVELIRTQNVVVSARPGAGKTATAEAIAADNPNRSTAIITYSRGLVNETARRLKVYSGINVFTFHELAGLLFSVPGTVRNDAILRSLRRKGIIPAWTGKPYEIIILDELQDCTDDLFWLINTFILAVTHAAGGKAPKIVVLGDERQAIYGFRGADARYLSLSSTAMAALSPYPWTHLALSKSFRLSNETTAFVNNVFLRGEQYIVGSHSGPKPLYLYGNVHVREEVPKITQNLYRLIHQYGPENTVILAPGVRNNQPLKLLANRLCKAYGFPIAVSNNDDVPQDSRVLQGKLCVNTYHQFKGSERDLVIVYGVDASNFKFLARDLPDDTCPNSTFVALTRARKHLVIVHDSRNRPMPFIDVVELHKTTNFVNLGSNKKMLKPEPPGRPVQLGLLLPKEASASDLPRHISDEVIDNICAKHLQIKKILPPLPKAEHINAKDIVGTDSIGYYHEAVSDLNGLAVVAACEHALLGTLTTLGISKASSVQFPLNTHEQAIWLCRETCNYAAQESGYHARRIQMKGHRFDWLGEHIGTARDRLKSQLSKTAVLDFEVQLNETGFCVADPLGGDSLTTNLYGRADIVQYEGTLSTSTENSKSHNGELDMEKIDSKDVSIWEIKFVAELSYQHVVQACVYAYLWSNKHKRETPPRISLFNVRDGEKWEIVPHKGVAGLRDVVEESLVAKYSTKDKLTTDEFLKKCAKTRAEVENSYKKFKQ